MVDEIYDVIDRNGKKIGVGTWEEVHAKGLLHKNVHGILFRDESRSQVLLKKRTSNAFFFPETIEIAAAGHVISGESPEEGIKREINEELFSNEGLPENILIRKINSYFNNDCENNNEIAYIFEIIYNGSFVYDQQYSHKPFWADYKNTLEDMSINPGKYARFSINALLEYNKSRSKYSKK